MKKDLLKVFFLPIVIIILIIFWIIAMYYTDINRGNTTVEDSMKYFNKIKKEYKNGNKEIELNQIFDFKWEKAYILPISWKNDNEIDQTIFEYCNVAPMDRDTFLSIIVFVNNEQCIYELIYDYRYISFSPTDIVIYSNDSILNLKKSNNKYELTK